MKLTHTLLLALATAALASCSAEPSDWRPNEKVSIDVIAPGTRPTENFDHSVPNGSIENANSPLIKAAEAEGEGEQMTKVPSAESAISANAEEGMRKRGKLNDAGKSSQADTTANGHQIQR